MTTKQITEIKNLDDLIAAQAAQLIGLQAGTIDRKNVDSFANAAGKIIATTKVQLEYFRDREELPSIPFIQGASSGTKKTAHPGGKRLATAANDPAPRGRAAPAKRKAA